MENILGENNSFLDYLSVIGIYVLVFLLIFYAKRTIELNFRKSFMALYLVWSVAMFTGNYFGYLGGVMSFLPWLNNFIHSFGWVGFALAWLYMTSAHLPWHYRFYLSAMFSFLIKFSENMILGSWSFDPYFFFEGKYAYLIIMSIVDGFYPLLSDWILKFLNKKSNSFQPLQKNA
jgi:hypothetical protein